MIPGLRIVDPASVPITPKLTALHGISNAMVAEAPQFWEIHEQLSTELTGKVLIAYSAEYDARMIRQTCELYKLPPLAAEWLCAMKMYQEHTGNTHRISLADAAAQCRV